MAKTLVGVVASDKADKTIVVAVTTRKTHRLYKKQYTSTRKFMAHDESNDAHVGDKVIIAETRPLSARKRHILDKVIERAPIRHIEEEPKIEAKTKEPAVRTKKVEKPKAKASKAKAPEEEE